MIHLALLTAYPIILGAIGFLAGRTGQSLIPTDPLLLLWAMGGELFTFAIVFGLAWLASRASVDQLLLFWRNGLQPVWRGLLYSVGLRLLVAVVVFLFAVAAAAFAGTNEELLKTLRPETEELVSAKALVENPLYLLLNLTFVSFVVAGLREELWRAGMLAGLLALFPRQFDSRIGRLAAVGVAAVVFGLGHLPQGWGGVMMTSVLGVGLGMIMVYHRSIWEAVLAHGFFDATTFLMLYLVARFRPELLAGAS
jgi:membrane protease YdiL (CAAX protease family)